MSIGMKSFGPDDIASVAQALEELDRALRDASKSPSLSQLDNLLAQALAPISGLLITNEIRDTLDGYCRDEILRKMGKGSVARGCTTFMQ